MRIKEFSMVTGLSSYTLRYYERLGLLRVLRDKNMNRLYQSKDVEWVFFVKRLKSTNMSLKDIKKYADLRYKGDDTMMERLLILENHRLKIIADIDGLKDSLDNLDKKIGYYKQAITNTNCL